MNRIMTFALGGTLAAAGSLGAISCSHSKPEALIQAERQYQMAAQGPAARWAPADLAAAKDALTRAQQSFNNHGKAQQSFDLAYVADRKARLATTKAGIAMAGDQTRVANDEATTLREELTEQQRNQLAAAQAGTAEAQRRAAEAELALQHAGAMRDTERGKVITLQGNVLFKTGRADLLPGATGSLDQVAAVLRNQADRQLLIEGFTDSTGTAKVNNRLSQQRAAAVRDYLVNQGVNFNQLSVEGRGSSAPIADNGTPDGRAMNRRVEITISNNPPTMGASNSEFNNRRKNPRR